jgi:putative transposase
MNIQTARQREAERRKKLLGSLADGEKHSYDEFFARACETYTSVRVLKQWVQAYYRKDGDGKIKGVEGLKPDWKELDGSQMAAMMERYHQLGEFADAEKITFSQIDELGRRNGWSHRQVDRWLRRYRKLGLWALAPANNPEKIVRRATAPRPLGLLNPGESKEMDRRRAMIGDLDVNNKLSVDQVNARAKELGIGASTLWGYIQAYREFGIEGLAPKRRADSGARHIISDRMVMIIEAIRLHRPHTHVPEIHDYACRMAELLAEAPPSQWQTQDICGGIPPVAMALARGENEYRSIARLAYHMLHDGSVVVYQLDSTPVDVLTIDMRSPEFQTESGQKRPYLLHIIEASSRAVVAARFTYLQPDALDVAAVIRDSMLTSANKPGGLPNAIWVDQGKQMVADHVRRFIAEAGSVLVDLAAHQPQLKGVCERAFGTWNTRLWSTLDGYVGSNTVERPEKVEPKYSLAELEKRFWDFINNTYHKEAHSQTGKTPLEFWAEKIYAPPVDPRKLDLLLGKTDSRTVQNVGIHWCNQVYWHSALGNLVGQSVIIRAVQSYAAPPEIEVFRSDSIESWVCTAFANNSEQGLSVTPEEINDAQRKQRESARDYIATRIGALKEANVEITEMGEQPPLEEKHKTKKTTAKSAAKKRAGKRDPWLDLSKTVS